MRHWHERMMQMAETVATWSKDPSTQVGAVIARPDRTIASVGFNGFPRNVEDLDARYEDRSTKYKFVVHAEVNAIMHAREPLDHCTLYVTPFAPCATCAGIIIQSGIKRVGVPLNHASDRWSDDMKAAATMFTEAGIEVFTVG